MLRFQDTPYDAHTSNTDVMNNTGIQGGNSVYSYESNPNVHFDGNDDSNVNSNGGPYADDNSTIRNTNTQFHRPNTSPNMRPK